MSEKYHNIGRLNKKIDVSGYFKGIKNIENEEYKMSGLMLLVGLIILSIALTLHKQNLLDFIVSYIAILISGLVFYKVFGIWSNYVSELLASRINEDDLNRLFKLKNNGEETKKVVNKILAEHEEGMLTYLAIAKHLEELVDVYNKERSVRVKEMLEAK